MNENLRPARHFGKQDQRIARLTEFSFLRQMVTANADAAQ